jgi:hypothetical protein
LSTFSLFVLRLGHDAPRESVSVVNNGLQHMLPMGLSHAYIPGIKHTQPTLYTPQHARYCIATKTNQPVVALFSNGQRPYACGPCVGYRCVTLFGVTADRSWLNHTPCLLGGDCLQAVLLDQDRRPYTAHHAP